MDEGWTRWVFDKYRIPFTTITAKDLPAGELERGSTRSSSRTSALRRRGRSRRAGRPERGGGAADVFAALDAFANDGGTMLAFNSSVERAIDALKLPVKNVLAGVRQHRFLRAGLDPRASSQRDTRSRAASRRRCRRSGSRTGRRSRSPIHAGDGRGELSGDRQPAAVRLAARRREARRKGRAGRREARARATSCSSASARSTAARRWRRTR